MSCIPVCNCNLSMSNTGSGCVPLINVTKKVLMIPVFDSTGVRNYIDLTGTIDQAFFTALINNADGSKRLFPLPSVIDVDDKRADAITQELSDGRKIFIRDGSRSFMGMIWAREGNPILKGKIESARCGDVGVYLVDRTGNLIGIVSEDKTKLYPIRIDSNSLSAMFIQPTDKTAQGIKLVFDFDPDENDACLGMITSAEMGDAEPLIFKGLIDVYAKYTTPTVNGVVVELYTDFGTPINPVRVEGLVAADMAFYNVTATSAIAITGTGAAFSEDAEGGTYTITYATADQPTVGHVIRLTPTKNGYDFSEVVADTFATA